MKPKSIFLNQFSFANLKKIYEESIEDGSAIGRDGISVNNFNEIIDKEINIIVRKVNSCNYEFTSYKEKLISKGANNPPRQISVPTIRDKIVLKFLSVLLAEIYPEHVPKMPHPIIKEVHRISSIRQGNFKYLQLDIENFYPSIDHKILLRIIRRRIRYKQILNLIENAITTPTGMKKTNENLNMQGVPQGLSISNLLSSLYLSDFDRKLKDLKKNSNVDCFRYVDDILLIGEEDKIEKLSISVPKLLKSKCKIKCHPIDDDNSKSRIVALSEGVDYLGYRFCKDEIEVRESSLKKMFSNIIKIISTIKYSQNKEPLIWKLNLRITGCQFLNKINQRNRRIGWLFFFSQSKNTKQLKRLDAFVSTQVNKVLKPNEKPPQLKHFVKAYHEIKFNLDNTDYIPNFDNFDDNQKKEVIDLFFPKLRNKQAKAITNLDQLFWKCIWREVRDLEKDLMEVFS